MSSGSALLGKNLGDLSEEQVYLLEAFLSRPEEGAQILERYPRNFDSGFVKLPASWAQERMWFIDQMQGSSWGYQVPVAIRLRGSLDRTALEEALNQLVMRHETLRTFFSNDDGVLSQVISARGDFALTAIDLSNLDLGVREQLVRRHMSEEAHAKFDLSSGPLIRGRLLILGAEEHVLLITIHHIV
ncbi:MAG: condensation domain-containing protein, partial [Candidatus Dormibacteraceae bacterium]